MSKKFAVFFTLICAVLLAEILYLQKTNENFDKSAIKSHFVALTGMNFFAFFDGISRFPFEAEINEIFAFYPGFKERQIGSFTQSGQYKIYE